MKKHYLLTFIIISINISTSFAQNKRGTFILGYGYSILADVAIAPYSKGMMVAGLSNNYISSVGVLKKDYSVSLLSLYLQVNTLLKEFNPNTSLSLNIYPGIRFSAGNYGLGSANMPITLNFNKGMLASYNTGAKMGFTLGMGVNALTSSLFNSGDKEFNPFVYVQPCIQLGFRSWTKYEEPFEVMLQVGYLTLKNADVLTKGDYYSQPAIIHNSMPNSSTSVRISLVRYLNY